MALKAIVDDINEVGESFRELYTERNGKFEITGIEGFKTQADVDRLQSALTKERGDHKLVKDRLGLLGDRKIEDVVTMLDRIPELEAAAQGKLDEDQLNQLVEGRIKSKLAPVERERDTFRTRIAELEGVVGQYETKERTRTIHDTVREAAGIAKILPEAMEDALMLAERVFEVTEDGKVVTRDNVGVTPGIEARVWFTDLQKTRPHWWGPSQGGGAGGNRGGGGMGEANPWSHEHWNMTEQGKILGADRSRADQLARAAGTTIGGQRPQPKK
jgi:hypothetical protein